MAFGKINFYLSAMFMERLICSHIPYIITILACEIAQKIKAFMKENIKIRKTKKL